MSLCAGCCGSWDGKPVSVRHGQWVSRVGGAAELSWKDCLKQIKPNWLCSFSTDLLNTVFSLLTLLYFFHSFWGIQGVLGAAPNNRDVAVNKRQSCYQEACIILREGGRKREEEGERGKKEERGRERSGEGKGEEGIKMWTPYLYSEMCLKEINVKIREANLR